MYLTLSYFHPAYTLSLTRAALVPPLERVHVEHVHAVLHAPVLPRGMLTDLRIHPTKHFLKLGDANSDAYCVASHNSSHSTVVEELGVEIHSASSLQKGEILNLIPSCHKCHGIIIHPALPCILPSLSGKKTHLSCTGKAELVGGHGHRGGGWVQTWYFQPCGNFSSWLELCTNPCGGYRLRLLGTQRSAQPKFCQLESFICMELEFLRLRAQNATSHFSPARLLYSAPYFRPPLHYSS